MGNGESTQLLGQSHSWKELYPSRPQIQGSPSLVCDETTREEADCYQITFYHRMDYQLQLLTKHQNMENLHILRLVDAKIKEKTILDCGDREVLQLYTEAVYCRLDEISLTQIEYLVVMHAVLKGFQELQVKGGNYFKVTEKMISISTLGQIRIWWNQHYGKQEVELSFLVRKEEDMVRSILNIFIHKCAQRYDFFQANTFASLCYSLQLFLKNTNRAAILTNIRDNFTKTTENHNPNKKRISDKSISAIKIKPQRRTSIDLGIEGNIETKTKQRQCQQKENRCHVITAEHLPYNIITNTTLNHTLEVPTSTKFSLAVKTIPSNTPISPFQKQTSCGYIRPIVRINYESSSNLSLKPPSHGLNEHSLTAFPKEQFSHINSSNRPSSLRPKCRQFSEIIERSQEGEDTQSEFQGDFRPPFDFRPSQKSKFFQTF